MRYTIIIVASVIALLLLVWIIATACGTRGDLPQVEATSTTAESVNPSTTSTGAAVETGASPTAAAQSEQPPVQTGTIPAASSSLATTATALAKLNLREGPGTNYPVVGSLSKDEQVTVVGRNEDGSWLVVKTDSGNVWLSGDPTLVKLESQSNVDLPVVKAPALPYNVNDPRVNLLLNQIPFVLHNSGSFTCVSHAGINNLDPLREGNVIGPHAGDLVYKGNNVLFKYTNGSLWLIRENPVARFEGGVESLPLAQAVQLFQTGDIVWTGELGQKPGRGVTGCDPNIR